MTFRESESMIQLMRLKAEPLLYGPAAHDRGRWKPPDRRKRWDPPSNHTPSKEHLWRVKNLLRLTSASSHPRTPINAAASFLLIQMFTDLLIKSSSTIMVPGSPAHLTVYQHTHTNTHIHVFRATASLLNHRFYLFTAAKFPPRTLRLES